MRLIIGAMLVGLLAVLALPAVPFSSGKGERPPRRPGTRRRIGPGKPGKRARRPGAKSKLSRREPAA
jgi:hypothetical protein